LANACGLVSGGREDIIDPEPERKPGPETEQENYNGKTVAH
jgi:hypothetical protein